MSVSDLRWPLSSQPPPSAGLPKGAMPVGSARPSFDDTKLRRSFASLAWRRSRTRVVRSASTAKSIDSRVVTCAAAELADDGEDVLLADEEGAGVVEREGDRRRRRRRVRQRALADDGLQLAVAHLVLEAGRQRAAGDVVLDDGVDAGHMAEV